MKQDRYLIISDLQIPFELNDALPFVRKVQREFRIPLENLCCVGDETDQYWGSLFKKSPEAKHTANQEIEATKEKLRKWYKAFPYMKICESNHGNRWKKKAWESEIPSQLLRQYREVMEAPDGWEWRKAWLIQTKKPFLMEHGDDWGGQIPHKQAALHNGISTIMGHHHSLAGVEYLKTNGLDVWGAICGSLIDFEQYAFEYARRAKFKPVIGCTVILNDGFSPLFVPYGSI